MAPSWLFLPIAAVFVAIVFCPLVAVTPPSASAAEPTLPGTESLTIERPIDELMVEGLANYARRQLAEARTRRGTRWLGDSSARKTADTRAALRERFRQLIGAVDARVTADESGRHRFEQITPLGESSVLAFCPGVTAHAIRWPVLDGVTAEGILLVPDKVRAGLVAVPDADWTPEQLLGPHGESTTSVPIVRRLAEVGCMVAIPTLISRDDEFSGHPQVRYTNQSHREFLYRQAFEVGRHVVGYEVQKVLAAVDLLEQHGRRARAADDDKPFPIGVAGFGEGGLLALYAAALDARIHASLVSGYFQTREGIWQEPIYRNVWGLLTDFGDAELARLIAPRRLVIEACRVAEVPGPPVAREGRAAVAAPGKIVTPPLGAVREEFERAAAYFREDGCEAALSLVVSGEDGAGQAGTAPALEALRTGLGLASTTNASSQRWTHVDSKQVDSKQAGAARDGVTSGTAAAQREKRQLDELQSHVQALLRRSHRVRDAQWRASRGTSREWSAAQPRLRDWVHDELIGRVTEKRLPPRPRSRRVLETQHYVGYEVILDVFDEVMASGILLLPKDIAAGERRPVVVCQHGLEGTPLDTITRDGRAFGSYKAFSDELARRGFIVFAPQNPYRGGDRFRVLQRLSNPLGRSMFSYIVAQHAQILEWLGALPQVDARRIAFYGLSYGGKTAMRVPPLLDAYALSICSGDFTDWPRTIAANDETFSYVFTTEYEIPEWNLAHVANYAEFAMLLWPRPFLVEAGHRDGGQPTDLVAGEFGKVRRHYDQLGTGDRAEIEFFDGPHTINGQASFRFLHRHLRWPEPRGQP